MKKSTIKLMYFSFLFSLSTHFIYAQSKLKLFEGTWEMKDERGGTMYEEWHRLSDSLYRGENYAVSENKKRVFETVLIKFVEGKLCYAPTVKDQNEGKEIVFPLKEITDDGKKFVFENMEHDFPQRIIYHFKNKSMLDARVEGTVDGKEKSSGFHFVKK
ncbi:MAG: DUF6265 family protein [Bacteroidota bacterium]